MNASEELEYCEVCGTNGWVHDELSSAMGGRWWRYCHCKHGERLGKEDDEAYRRKQEESPYKTCPTCGGDGTIKKG